MSFDAFFTHILMHELMHGLGPHNITVGGRATTVRQELKDTYSAIEEAKADVSGLFALQFLVDRGKLDQTFEPDDVHDVSGVDVPFDPVRHQRGARPRRRHAAQLLPGQRRRDRRVRTARSRSTLQRIRQNVIDLTRDIMTLQAVGGYTDATQMIEKLAVIRPPVQTVLDRLKDVPVDIEPRFVTAEQLVGERASRQPEEES